MLTERHRHVLKQAVAGHGYGPDELLTAVAGALYHINALERQLREADDTMDGQQALVEHLRQGLDDQATTIAHMKERMTAAEAFCKAYSVWEITPVDEEGSSGPAYRRMIATATIWQKLAGWTGRDTVDLKHEVEKEAGHL